MAEEKKTTKEEVTKDAPKTAEAKKIAPKGGEKKEAPKKREFKKNERPRRPRRGGKPRERREFDQKIISIRRVTRVVAGGRRFAFSVSMVIGDRKGRVGVGIGKASDTALAIEKAIRDAKKNMITIKRTKSNSIAHDVNSKYCAARVQILPAKGRGIVAGSSVRNVLELGGVTDVTAKIFSRSKNQINNARAAVNALLQLS